MKMNMKYILHSGLTVSEKKIDPFTLEPRLAENFSHFLRDAKHLSTDLWIKISKIGGMRVGHN